MTYNVFSGTLNLTQPTNGHVFGSNQLNIEPTEYQALDIDDGELHCR